DVGGGERGAQVAGELARARVEVGLEGGDEAPGRQRARRGERGRDLGRVVGVVVVDGGAGRRRAQQLGPPPGALRVGERGGRPGRAGAGGPRRLERGGGVERVVGAGHAQADLVAAPGEADPGRVELRVGHVVGRDGDGQLGGGLAGRGAARDGGASGGERDQ